MTAVPGSKISALTLQVLQDLNMGYTVDLSTAETMSWGNNTGCGFHTERCDTVAGGRGTYFCFDETGATGCSPNYEGIGSCDTASFPVPLPQHFRYFADAHRGGSKKFMDYCPYHESYTSSVCADTTHHAASDATAAHLGLTFGRDSRCFVTTKNFSALPRVSSFFAGRCLNARCAAGGILQFQVFGGPWIDCPANRGAGDVTVPGFAGTVSCPSFANMCGGIVTVPARTAIAAPDGANTTTAEPTTRTTTSSMRTPTATSHAETLSVSSTARTATQTIATEPPTQQVTWPANGSINAGSPPTPGRDPPSVAAAVCESCRSVFLPWFAAVAIVICCAAVAVVARIRRLSKFSTERRALRTTDDTGVESDADSAVECEPVAADQNVDV
jgi:hypothetical protein